MKSLAPQHDYNSKFNKRQQFYGKEWKKLRKCCDGRKLFLFGAGRVCEKFLSKIDNKVKIDGILENDMSRCGKMLCGIKIISAEHILDYEVEKIVVLISSTKYENEIRKQLKRMGIFYVFSVGKLSSKKPLFKRLYDALFSYHFGFFSNHNYFYNYVVFHILAVLRIMHFPPAYFPYKGIEGFKGCHKGERCFIVATGPSLRVDDLELLKKNGEITFSMNSIFNIYESTEWRPDYYAIEDPKFDFLFDWSDEKYNIDKACMKAAFFPVFYRQKCKKFQKAHFYPISFLGHLMKHNDTKMKFSKDFLWGIYCAYTVTNVCIQLAQYMGFSEVYLLGVDCNYSGAQKHFAKEKDDYKYTEEYARQVYDNLIRGYDFIGKHVAKYGTKVYNATRGGALEVFERVELESLLKKQS